MAKRKRIRVPRPCAHCKRVLSIAARGLCSKCHREPAIRDKHEPQTDGTGRRGLCDAYGTKLATFPTQELPGTPKKMKVMEQRAERGESVFHPLDAKWGQAADEEPLPVTKNKANENRRNAA